MITFKDQVAIVTGAGHGLGRAHAVALAERGASVVVNDVGGSSDGTGASPGAAQAVVSEIVQAGGQAVASGADVTDEHAVGTMVLEAVDRWGRIDILVNNAGILRDSSFGNMDQTDFDAVLDVHLRGTVICTKAVWPHMRAKGRGRIVVTTSSSGLYGNFGQANYGAAKMGVVGLMNTLRAEGKKYDIRVNAFAPAAHTRMTDSIFPEEVKTLLAPEETTAAVLFLVSEDAPNGIILAAGGGSFAAVRIYETAGIWLTPTERTPENIAARLDEILDDDHRTEFVAGAEQVVKFVGAAVAGEEHEG